MSAPRGKPNRRPFAWCEKAALKLIRQACEPGSGNRQPDVTALYMAMCEFASDEGHDSFTKSIREIAARAGISTRQAQKFLPVLKDLELIEIRHNHIPGQKALGYSTYTLLSVNPGAHYAPPSGIACGTLTHGKSSFCAECIEEHFVEEKKNKGSFSDLNPRPLPHDEDDMFELLLNEEVEFDRDIAGSFFRQMDGNGWKLSGKPIADWVAVFKARVDVITADRTS